MLRPSGELHHLSPSTAARVTLASTGGAHASVTVEVRGGSAPMMWWYGGGPGWGGWLMIALILLAFWALVVFGGVALYRTLRRNDHPPASGPDPAERLLDERLARGEIDIDEYTARRDLLRSSRR
jgi:putative membrane protein